MGAGYRLLAGESGSKTEVRGLLGDMRMVGVEASFE